MLKLLKHDLKNSWLEVIIFNALTIAMGLALFIVVKNTQSNIYGLFIFGWVFALAASLIVAFKSIITSFHKSLFTDYGYLTLTTPVSIDKILISKILVNMLWLFVTILSIVLSSIIILNGIADAFDMIKLIFETFGAAFDVNQIGTIILWGISAFVSILYMVLMLVFVLTFANSGRLKKHKFIWGILIYLALGFVISILNTVWSQILADLNGTAQTIISIFINLVYSAIFYFVARYLITTKLELE